MPEYSLYLINPKFPKDPPAKFNIAAFNSGSYYEGAEVTFQGVRYIVDSCIRRTPHPRIKRINGRWVVEYTRLWDSERNYQNPNYKQEVITAIQQTELWNALSLLEKFPKASYPSITKVIIA